MWKNSRLKFEYDTGRSTSKNIIPAITRNKITSRRGNKIIYHSVNIDIVSATYFENNYYLSDRYWKIRIYQLSQSVSNLVKSAYYGGKLDKIATNNLKSYIIILAATTLQNIKIGQQQEKIESYALKGWGEYIILRGAG